MQATSRPKRSSRAAKGADKALVDACFAFSMSSPANRSARDQKSVAIEVTLQPRDRTLTDEEIDKVSAAIVAAVQNATGGVLRT